MEEEEGEVQLTTKLNNITDREAILVTADSLTADKAAQDDKMMLTKLGRWVPIIYSQEKMQYSILTSPSIASILLSKNEATGTWNSPTNNNSHSLKEAMEVDGSYFIQHLKITR